MKSIDMRRAVRDRSALGRRVFLAAALAFVMAYVRPIDRSTARGDDAVANPKAEDVAPADDPAEVQRRQQIKQQATHWEQQLTKLLYGDLELIRSAVGDIPRDARRAIARAGEQAVQQAAVQLAELQFGGSRRQVRVMAGEGGIVIGGAGNLLVADGKLIVQGGGASGRQVDESTTEDPVDLVSKALAKSLAEHVGSEQAVAFTRQIVERSERRKAAAVHEIVAVLDGELVLTAAQRERIERSLLDHWSDAMVASLEGMHWSDDRRVFPGLPDACISPHLTDAQRRRFGPQGNGGGGRSQRQTWVRMNVLNNVHSAARDPWWFE